MQLHHSLHIRPATWRLADRVNLMIMLKIEIGETWAIPLTYWLHSSWILLVTTCHKFERKLWITLPPYHQTFPIILTMNLISLVNTDIAPGQQTPVPTFQEDIHMKGESLSHSHYLQTYEHLKWSSTAIVNDLFIFTFSSAEFLYLLVAVFTDTSSVIYWRKNAIRKLNVINQRCQFLAQQ